MRVAAVKCRGAMMHWVMHSAAREVVTVGNVWKRRTKGDRVSSCTGSIAGHAALG